METPVYPQRKNTRLRDYDYSTPGAYFITICTFNRLNILGVIQDGLMTANTLGGIVAQSWAELPLRFPHIHLDEFTLMPNHVHVIIVIDGEGGPPLSAIIRAFKSCTSMRTRDVSGEQVPLIWQRGFYDHVIRNDSSLKAIREYIINNPLGWEQDDLNPDRRTNIR